MTKEKITFDIFPSKKGAPSISIIKDGKTLSLHSSVDPLREADLFRDRFRPDRFDLLIVLGTGLGYHLMPLEASLLQYRRVILVDALPGLAAKIRDHGPASFLCTSPNVVFITGETAETAAQRLSGLVDLDGIRGIDVLEHPASVKIFDEYYSEIRDAVKSLIEKKAGHKATRKAFAWIFIKNIVRHLKSMGQYRGFASLRGAFESYPVLIAASGPSLEDNLAEMKRHQDRFFIMCADSAARVLLSAGILPDFIVTIDPQAFTHEHLQGVDTGNALLLCSISSRPLQPGRRNSFLYLNSHPLCQILARTGDRIGSLEHETGTVAGDALDLAFSLGFRKAALAGYDFAFHRNKIYPRGSAYQKRFSLYFQDRLSTVEGRNMGYIRGSSRGLHESGRSTRRSFLQYKSALESLVRSAESRKVYQLGTGGLDISGVPRLSLGEFAADHCGGLLDKERILSARSGPIPELDFREARSLKSILQDGSILRETLRLSFDTDDQKSGKKFMRLINGI